jgi:hypothetical protein
MLPKEVEEKEEKPFHIEIPECCREGWESCPHSVKREKEKKSNVGV